MSTSKMSKYSKLGSRRMPRVNKRTSHDSEETKASSSYFQNCGEMIVFEQFNEDVEGKGTTHRRCGVRATTNQPHRKLEVGSGLRLERRELKTELL